MRTCNRKEPVTNGFLEREAEILKTGLCIGAGQSTRQSDCRIHIDNKGEIRLLADHQIVQLIDFRPQIATGRALINTGTVCEAVTHNNLSRLKCGANGLFQVISAGSGEQKDFCFRRPAVSVTRQDKLTDFFGADAAARFTRVDHIVALGTQPFSQHFGLSRFAGPVDPFKGNELSAGHYRLRHYRLLLPYRRCS